jgi:hypothetical protein
MIDELVEKIVPGGIWLAAGIAVGATFGESLRPIVIRAMKTGIEVADRLQAVGAEAYEKAEDMMAEARHERERDRVRAATNGSRTAASRRRPVRAQSGR